MAFPIYLVLIGGSFAAVIAFGLFTAVRWFAQQGQQGQLAATQSSNQNRGAQGQTKGTQQQAMAMALSPDAFDLKEQRRQKLLDKARKRYMEIHPEFVAPAKDKEF